MSGLRTGQEVREENARLRDQVKRLETEVARLLGERRTLTRTPGGFTIGRMERAPKPVEPLLLSTLEAL